MSVTEAVRSTEIGHRYLPVASIDASKTNPRKHFDKEKLAELGESILRHGVVQPILVRPKGDRFELIAGERRLRAARDVGLSEIPAIVRDLTDQQALEVQVIENLQRTDLHPLEEAEGYAKLLHEYGYDADSLAEKIGKSRSYVYGRMKLADLCETAKKALWDDKISHSVALLIARIADEKLQKEAVEGVSDHSGPTMSYREAAEYIQREFMLRLDQAPFDREDAQLVAGAGPCTTCPFRTANQKELFGDVKSADVCTKPSCFQEKAAAQLRIDAEAKGWQSLTAKQSKDLFFGGLLNWGAAYVEADAQAFECGSYGKTYKQVVPKSTPLFLATDDRGKTHKLYAKRDLPKRKLVRTPSAPRSADNTKWARERDLSEAIEAALAAAVAKKVTKATKVGEIFPAIAAAVVDDRGWITDEVSKRLALPKKPKKFNSEGIVEWVRELKPEQRILLVASILFFEDYGEFEVTPAAKYFYDVLGIDAAAIAASEKATLEEKWAAEDAKTTKKSTSAKPKKPAKAKK